MRVTGLSRTTINVDCSRGHLNTSTTLLPMGLLSIRNISMLFWSMRHISTRLCWSIGHKIHFFALQIYGSLLQYIGYEQSKLQLPPVTHTRTQYIQPKYPLRSPPAFQLPSSNAHTEPDNGDSLDIFLRWTKAVTLVLTPIKYVKVVRSEK